MNPGAASVQPETLERLRRALPEAHLADFGAGLDLSGLAGEGPVIVAGGDGTVAAVARALAGSRRPIGILPLGTFNNFARSLGLPTDLEAALAVVRSGRPRPVTLGMVNRVPFVEAAAVGLFGELLAAGEALKELSFGGLGAALAGLASSSRFRYRLTGDLRRAGTTLTLLAANTPTVGAHLGVGRLTPVDPYLELVLPGARRALRFRRLRIETEPPARVFADLADAGTTPAEIEAVPGGLAVILGP